MDLNLVDFFLCEGTVEGDVLKDVVLLGPESSNDNSYSVAAMRSALPLYEGHAIYLDHDLKAKARKTHERFGHAQNCHVVEQDHDGKPRLRGDVPFLRSHPMAAAVVEAYQKKLPYFGISHVADGVGRQEGKKRLVEQITKLRSLDLVDKAATGSLVEQADAPADPAAMHADALAQMVMAVMMDASLDKEAKKKKINAYIDAAADGTPAAGDGKAAPPMSEQALTAATVGTLVEQAVSKALTTALPTLVEQEVQRRAAEAKYVKPVTQPPAPPRAPAPSREEIPTDPEKRKAWLRSA